MIRSKIPSKAYLDNYDKIFSAGKHLKRVKDDAVQKIFRKVSGDETRVQDSESKKSEERIQSKDKTQG